MADLEQFGSGKPDVWSVTFTFSLIAIFYLLEIENRTYAQSSHAIALNKGTVLAKNSDFLQKMMTSEKLRRALY